MPKQLELPFTPRGRRLLRRAKGQNRRAWTCTSKYSDQTIYVAACDNAEARKHAMNHFKSAFLDVKARRCPLRDEEAQKSEVAFLGEA